MTRTSAAISPTAHYTGYTWFDHGLSHPALVTPIGRWLYDGLRPLNALFRATGRPTLPGFLLARHRAMDQLLDAAIEEGRVTQVIEIAAGLSPRGWDFKRRHGARLRYIEADLPKMAEHKLRRLERGGLLSPGHRVATLDALADEGPQSLAALATKLDPTQGLAIVTEGLLNYFDRAAVEGMWRRFAGVLGQFPQGLYLSDLHLGEANRSVATQAFSAVLSGFVRGRVHLHFDAAAEAEAALQAAGLPGAQLHDPRQLLSPAAAGPGAELVRVVEVRTRRR
ncbi:MAG TPA: class I SAM-dependent methyltransferase [Solimonas sp.]|nr:class I SAM-dependent methyltransferase [Solimonas sp.]